MAVDKDTPTCIVLVSLYERRRCTWGTAYAMHMGYRMYASIIHVTYCAHEWIMAHVWRNTCVMEESLTWHIPMNKSSMYAGKVRKGSGRHVAECVLVNGCWLMGAGWWWLMGAAPCSDESVMSHVWMNKWAIEWLSHVSQKHTLTHMYGYAHVIGAYSCIHTPVYPCIHTPTYM